MSFAYQEGPRRPSEITNTPEVQNAVNIHGYAFGHVIHDNPIIGEVKVPEGLQEINTGDYERMSDGPRHESPVKVVYFFYDPARVEASHEYFPSHDISAEHVNQIKSQKTREGWRVVQRVPNVLIYHRPRRYQLRRPQNMP